jgi:hypothetical protein
LLQAAYSNYQIGAFENFHQLFEDTLIVLRPGPKVFFQYELRFVNRLKSQLLISHLFFPHQRNAVRPGKRSKKSSRLLGDIPAFLDYPINFCFNAEGPQAPDRGASWFHTLSEVPWQFDWPPRLRAGAFVKVRCWRRFSEVGRSPA